MTEEREKRIEELMRQTARTVDLSQLEDMQREMTGVNVDRLKDIWKQARTMEKRAQRAGDREVERMASETVRLARETRESKMNGKLVK